MPGVKVRIKSNNGALSTKLNPISVCANGGIKIEKIFHFSSGFTIYCSDNGNAEKLFELGVLSTLLACEFIPQAPPEIKAGRSVILKDLDTYLYDHSSDEIIGDIHQHNDWAKLSEVFKFPNSRSIKLVFTHSALVEMCLSRGLNMFFMHVPGSHIKKETHAELIKCFRCFAIEDHLSFSCTKDSTYKVCSSCSAEGHDWRNCDASYKKGLNCHGNHHSLANSLRGL